MQIQFYHLTTTPLETALPKLLEKAHGAGMRVLVKVESDEVARALNTHLWEYTQESFLPHGMANEDFAETQPILLSTALEPKNGAKVWLLTDGSTLPADAAPDRLLDMFNGRDDAVTAAARLRWKTYKDAGHEMSYFKQNENGGWEKAA